MNDTEHAVTDSKIEAKSPSDLLGPDATIETYRAQLEAMYESARVMSEYYMKVLSFSLDAEETLRGGLRMICSHLDLREVVDHSKEAWAWIFEDAFGLDRGWSTAGADGEAAALAREAFERELTTSVLSVPESDTFFVVPLPDTTGATPVVGMYAIPLRPEAEMDQTSAYVAMTLGASTVIHMDHSTRVKQSSRSLQYSRAAARAQRRLVEPTNLPQALLIVIEALEHCEDLVGARAELIEGETRQLVAEFGDIDSQVTGEDGTLEEPEALVLLPVRLESATVAEIILRSRSSLAKEEDETLQSIASAVEGAVARHRAAATIEDLRRSTTRRLVEAQERERSMVAADIHDGVLQQLGATAIRLELAQARVEQRDFDTASEIIADGANEIRYCARELRSLLMELRPQVLDDNGLNSALIELGRHVEDVEVSVRSDVPDDLGSEFSITIFRIVQEALTNIQKHAKAKSANVDVQLKDDRIQIDIADDGIGFEGAVTGPSAEGSHLGLLGMRERARMFGGTFSISGVSGGGTQINATLPLDGLVKQDLP